MDTLLRRLRGVAGVGLTWAAIRTALGGLLGLAAKVISPEVKAMLATASVGMARRGEGRSWSDAETDRLAAGGRAG